MTDPSFSIPAVVSGYRIVFPRTSVLIRTSAARPYVSNPTLVEYYNDGQEYVRGPIDARGDETEWFSVDAGTAREAVALYDPRAAGSLRPFSFASAPTDPRAYSLQRQLFRAMDMAAVDPLTIEESALAVLHRVVAAAYGHRRDPRPYSRADREIAMRAAEILSRFKHRRVPLRLVSDSTGISPFHLARVFRRVTGRTLARYHLELRLFAALGPLFESTVGLDAIAASSGFKSHSHFTEAFRKFFGMTPSAARRTSAPRYLNSGRMKDRS